MARQCPNFSWFVEKKLAGLAYPSGEDMAFLAEQGVKTIINLCEGPSSSYSEEATAAGIRVVESISIVDFTPPTHQQIVEFLDIVTSSIEVSHISLTIEVVFHNLSNLLQPVAVHCMHGLGRTGTMLACYLVAEEGLSAESAIKETRRRRRYSIETREQEQVVDTFEKNLNAKASKPINPLIR